MYNTIIGEIFVYENIQVLIVHANKFSRSQQKMLQHKKFSSWKSLHYSVLLTKWLLYVKLYLVTQRQLNAVKFLLQQNSLA